MKALLQELATEAREVNAANGWGLGFDPNNNRDTVPSYLALIASEITEAQTAPGLEAALAELGDVIIRCLDLCELLMPGYIGLRHEKRLGPQPGVPQKFDPRYPRWERELLSLYALVSAILETYRKVDDWRPEALYRLLSLAMHVWNVMEGLGGNPEKVIRTKLANNRTRGYRHGGRRT